MALARSGAHVGRPISAGRATASIRGAAEAELGLRGGPARRAHRPHPRGLVEGGAGGRQLPPALDELNGTTQEQIALEQLYDRTSRARACRSGSRRSTATSRRAPRTRSSSYARQARHPPAAARGLKQEQGVRRRDSAALALTGFRSGQGAGLNDAQFQISLIGQSSLAVAQLTKAREVDHAAAQAAAQFDIEAYPRSTRKIFGAADTLKNVWGKAIQEAYDKERAFLTGAKAGFRDYIEEATNAGRTAHDALGNSLKGLEDSLDEFFATGKTDWHNYANAVLREVARIPAKLVTTGVASLGSRLFNSESGPEQLSGPVAEAMGGIVGPRGVMPLSRYAAGGIADRPQLAVFGEGAMNEAFVPLPDGRRIPVQMRGGGGGTFVIDARGADRAGIEDLKRLILQINGSIETRAGPAALAHRLNNPSAWRS
jgi:hypothetical protein